MTRKYSSIVRQDKELQSDGTWLALSCRHDVELRYDDGSGRVQRLTVDEAKLLMPKVIKDLSDKVLKALIRLSEDIDALNEELENRLKNYKTSNSQQKRKLNNRVKLAMINIESARYCLNGCLSTLCLWKDCV